MQVSSLLHINFSFKKKYYQNGFTLMELLISMAIISIITGIVLVKYNSFDSTVLLKNQAYEIALLLRESQIKSVSVVRNDADTFSYPYGASFAPASSMYQSFLYKDSLQYPHFDTGPTEITGSFDMGKKMQVEDVCVTDDLSSGVEDCTITQLDISFRRPEFSALFWAEGYRSGSEADMKNILSARIHLASTNGGSNKFVVEISRLGQISVYNE